MNEIQDLPSRSLKSNGRDDRRQKMNTHATRDPEEVCYMSTSYREPQGQCPQEGILQMSFQGRAGFHEAPKAGMGRGDRGRDPCVQRCRKDVEKLSLRSHMYFGVTRATYDAHRDVQRMRVIGWFQTGVILFPRDIWFPQGKMGSSTGIYCTE